MTNERKAWIGPKELFHRALDDIGDERLFSGVIPVGWRHDKEVCANCGRACAFEPLEPKGLSEEEQKIAHYAAGAWPYHDSGTMGRALLRLSAELAAVTAERDNLGNGLVGQGERAERAEADALSDLARAKRAETKMLYLGDIGVIAVEKPDISAGEFAAAVEDAEYMKYLGLSNALIFKRLLIAYAAGLECERPEPNVRNVYSERGGDYKPFMIPCHVCDNCRIKAMARELEQPEVKEG